jgi:hypothetical protein
MKFDLDQSTIELAQGKLVSLADAEGSTVAVLWGKVWLTQDGDRRDYDLSAGDSFTINGDGLILVSALENSALTILQPCTDLAVSTPELSDNASPTGAHNKLSEHVCAILAATSCNSTSAERGSCARGTSRRRSRR